MADDKAGSQAEVKVNPFSVRLLDEDGKAVSGAIAGVTAYFGDKKGTLPLADDVGWQYWHGATADAEGIVQLPDGGAETSNLCVVARHTSRELAGIWRINSEKLSSDKISATITMSRACRVSGRLGCGELAKLNREVGWTNVYLESLGNRALGCSSTEGGFHFYVPVGKYVLRAYGANLHWIEKEIIVEAGKTELKLEFDLPATRLALLQGQPAPSLEGIVAWKNGPAVDLGDLKGKCVILDFWGYWCGPCVGRMPELFELYDKYHDHGLEIVGIHIDLGSDEKDPVDAVEKLDVRLSKIRQEIWNGRDIPYPVGLVSGTAASFGDGIEKRARSMMSARYGVTSYPTLILIDPKGNVVGRFSPSVSEHVDHLEKLLKEK